MFDMWEIRCRYWYVVSYIYRYIMCGEFDIDIWYVRCEEWNQRYIICEKSNIDIWYVRSQIQIFIMWEVSLM